MLTILLRKLGAAAILFSAVQFFSAQAWAQAKIIDDELIEADIQSQGRATVIVSLADPVPQRGAAATPAIAAFRQTAMQQLVQRTVGNAVGPGAAAHPVFMPWVGYVAVSVTRSELARLSRDPGVDMIAYNRSHRAFGEPRPVAHTASASWFTWDQLIRLEDARLSKTLGDGAVVVVLDTGVNMFLNYFAGLHAGHEACFSYPTTGQASTCPNEKSEQIENQGATPCVHGGVECGHGTFVASIIAGLSQDGTFPLFGIAQKAKILPINISAKGAFNHLYWNDVALGKAIDYLAKLFATDQNLQLKKIVVNMSFGTDQVFGKGDVNCRAQYPKLIPALKNLILLAEPTLVAAVGPNVGKPSRTGMAWPACRNEVIDVGGSDFHDEIASPLKQPFSNFAFHYAPSQNMVGLVPGSDVMSPHGVTAMDSGSKYAAPQASAMAAILRTCCGGDLELILALKIFTVQTGAGPFRLGVTKGISAGRNKELIYSTYGVNKTVKTSCTFTHSLPGGDCLAGMQLPLGTGGTGVKYAIVFGTGSVDIFGNPTPISTGKQVKLTYDLAKLAKLPSQTFNGTLYIRNLTLPKQTSIKGDYIPINYSVVLTKTP